MSHDLHHKYSDYIYNKKVLVIGPCPPPLGGVAVHIKRVAHKLRMQNNNTRVYNTAKKYSNKLLSLVNFIKKLFNTKPNIVCYHEPTESIQKLAITVLLRYFLRYKLITIDHDCRVLYKFKNLKKFIFNFLIKKIDACVVIGNTTDQCYLDNKIEKIKNYSIESPFLPPNLDEEKTILREYPTKTDTFIKTHTPLISANAFAPILVDNKDLYGFDACIELIKELKKIYSSIGIIFGICKIETNEQKKYFEQIKKIIKELDLETNFYFIASSSEFWPLIKQSDIFVRPTRSDSFGISVQEAITLGVPAIASDVCIRPQETILFKTENTIDFVEKVMKSLSGKISCKKPQLLSAPAQQD
ncbi:glycosyltransferase [Candidatus Dependentiae bacterium]|nr:glycosyltransferase [Candidatus Dependentiae bacterium]